MFAWYPSTFSVATGAPDGGDVDEERDDKDEDDDHSAMLAKFRSLTVEKVVPPDYLRSIPPNLALGIEGPTEVEVYTSISTMDSISEQTMVCANVLVILSYLIFSTYLHTCFAADFHVHRIPQRGLEGSQAQVSWKYYFRHAVSKIMCVKLCKTVWHPQSWLLAWYIKSFGKGASVLTGWTIFGTRSLSSSTPRGWSGAREQHRRSFSICWRTTI